MDKPDSNMPGTTELGQLRGGIPMIITTEIFEGYLSCKYKTHLRLREKTNHVSEFSLVHRQWIERYKDRALQILKDQYHLDNEHPLISCQNDLSDGARVLFGYLLRSQKMECQCDALEKVQGESGRCSFYYIPIMLLGSVSIGVRQW